MRTAIYPGSFDPITLGHLDVMRRAAALFDEVIVAVAENDQKKPLFDKDERVGLIEEAAAGIPRIRVVTFGGLVVRFRGGGRRDRPGPGPSRRFRFRV